MPMPNGEIIVERTGTDNGESWTQLDPVPLSEFADVEDVVPDWVAIKAALGVSSQTKAQNTAGNILARILGI